jgi:hypothetical protein
MDNSGYVVFENPIGHDLNLVGVRSKEMRAGAFDDWIMCFYRMEGKWVYFAFPGTYYLENPLRVKGTAVLKPG